MMEIINSVQLHCLQLFLTKAGAMDRRQNYDPSSSTGTPILDVKPLRSLAPMFPAPFGFAVSTSSVNSPPFVCITPFNSLGSDSEKASFPPTFPSFPPGVGTYINGCQDGMSVNPLQTPPTKIVPLSEDSSMYSEQTGGKRKKLAGSSGAEGSIKKRSHNRKKHSKAQDLFLIPSSSDDPREPVEVVLLAYDALRRRLLQIDETNKANKNSYLKAMSLMMDNNLRINVDKAIGPVPGINIGDIFYFRFEMCLVGLHAQSMAGIDYMNVKIDNENDTLAVSIVSSGGYDNDTNDADVLVYSGQGGTKVSDGKKQVDDQKLERGNLALERSLHRANLIRVIRGTKDHNSQTGKIYIYDGLYKILESWVEKGKEGFNVFKYKLVREPGQPDGFAIWKMTNKWRENPSSRGGVTFLDLSYGEETFPVCVVNEVDGDQGPYSFSYSTKVRYLKPMSSEEVFQGCACNTTCVAGNSSCHCAQQNEGDLPYSTTGILVRRKPIIYECSSLCQCSATCQNRATQRVPKFHFEVFKTTNKGWGLRCWDPIRAGTFICEYVGELIDKDRYDVQEDDYIFETNEGDKTFKWNYGPELLGEPSVDESWESSGISPIMITAKNFGNISRFMNHSCSPNVFWQLVQREHGDEGYPHVMFFAVKHIPPMTELTYDYGQHGRRSKICLCGSVKCRGSFG